jgi:hypothetical protein
VLILRISAICLLLTCLYFIHPRQPARAQTAKRPADTFVYLTTIQARGANAKPQIKKYSQKSGAYGVFSRPRGGACCTVCKNGYNIYIVINFPKIRLSFQVTPFAGLPATLYHSKKAGEQ